MRTIRLAMIGKASSVFEMMRIIGTTSREAFDQYPEYWKVRAVILAADHALVPHDGKLAYNLKERKN